jgi:hypothetical protein
MRSGKFASILIAMLTLSACSETKLFESIGEDKPTTLSAVASEDERRSTIWDALTADSASAPVKVNRYIWQAALEVLDFMPVETIDPFSGIIAMGYGIPPGGNTAYRATVHVSEPALDARTLRIALATKNGPADAKTMRALEDAVLSRARQIREADSMF